MAAAKPLLALPAASIVVPSRNERAHIEACLRSILAFHSPRAGFEVLVVDGMSDDGTREIVTRLAREDARVRLLDNPRRTVPCAMNEGIRAARAGIIVRIDAHAECAPDYLVECLRTMEETGADNVGGPCLTRARSYWQRANAAAYHSPFTVGNARFHFPQYEGPVDTVVYGCYRKQTLLDLGLYDEELTRNQDDELNLRLVRRGGRIWQSPRIRSWYYPRASLGDLVRQYVQYGYWKVRVIQKHRVPASWRHLVPGTFVAAVGVGAALAPWVPLVRWAWLGMLMLYLACSLAASAWIARRRGWELLPALPLVIGAYHFGYGWGFLRGVVDFLIRRRNSPSVARFERLTR
ncbi:MAG: glycosyltransferase family 2 protein [Dehalococcoidia bacterium]